MFRVEHFKTEFVRTAHAKIMGRGRLAITMRQLMMAVVCGALLSGLVRLLPIPNWTAVFGIAIGIWLGSDRDGAMQVLRFFMPLLVWLRSKAGRPQQVDISAEWQSFEENED